ncbi:MAG: hypothetical protein RJB13_753 [Pseudomonadota bacterium]|jgi:hypothetical protein
MSDSVSVAESSVFLASPEATVRIHNPLLFGEDFLWGAHILFAVLALVGVFLIVLGRGPRRADANFVNPKELSSLNVAVPAAEQTQS